MKKPLVSNYEKLCSEWALRFLDMDIPLLMNRLTELKLEGDYLTLRHFCRKLGVHLKNGRIFPMEDHYPVTHNEQLNVYTLLWYANPNASLSGEWLPFERLKNASPFGVAFKKGILLPFAETFSGQMDKLIEARDKLNGLPLSISDAGFELKGFECIPMRLYFWDEDDEFPAHANLLFDRSAADFIHVESIVTIAALGVRRIAETAGLTLSSSVF